MAQGLTLTSTCQILHPIEVVHRIMLPELEACLADMVHFVYYETPLNLSGKSYDMRVEAFVTQDLLDLLLEFRIGLSFRGLKRLKINDKLTFYQECSIEKYANFVAGYHFPLNFGAFTYSNSALPPEFSAGRYCSIGRNVTVMGPDHPVDRVSSSPFTYSLGLPSLRAYFEDTQQDPYRPRRFVARSPSVTLGNDVWVGSDVLFARGISVGDGAIIAARAVVTRDVPPFSIVAGVPARVIRMRFSDKILEEISQSAWWRYAPDVIVRADPSKPDSFIERLQDLNPMPLCLPVLTGAQIMDCTKAR